MTRVLLVLAVGAGLLGLPLALSVTGDSTLAAGTILLEEDDACAAPGGIPDTEPVDELDATQVANVTTVVEVGRRLEVPLRGLVVAVATIMQESGARNLASYANPGSLDYPHDAVAPGDFDSVGLFQQRDAWGPLADRMDPAATAAMFYTGGRGGQPGLLDIAGWEAMEVWEAAQAVQVSAFPNAYARWEPVAFSAVTAVLGGEVAAELCTQVTQVAATSWTAPMAAGSYRLSSGFGYRIHPILGYRRLHSGSDFAADRDTPILAAAAGRVVKAGSGGGYGNLVILDHGSGLQTYYAHQCDGCLRVGVGDLVAAGQRVGGVGTTGRSTGNHLHFEVRRDGTPVDPVDFLAELGIQL